MKNKVKINFDLVEIKKTIEQYIKEIKPKLSNLTLDDIKEFIGKYKNAILTILFSGIILLGIFFSIFLGLKTWGLYKETNKMSEEISLVKEKNIIDYIKKNNLRSLDSFAYSYGIFVNKSKIDNKFKNLIAKAVIYSAIESKGTNKINLSILKDKLLAGLPNSDNISLNTIKDIVLYAHTDRLKEKFPKYYKKINSNFDNFLSSQIVRSYLSSFPRVYSKKVFLKLKGIDYKAFSNVLSKLYVWELIFIRNNLEKQAQKEKKVYESYQEPYNKFLSIIFLPSVNIWKNPFSGKINVDLFGLRYLSLAKYIDLNLVNYWSDYFTYSYKGLLYQGDRNEIQDIIVNNFVDYKGKNVKNIKILPLSVKFGLDSDKSFYGLLSRLTSTSNVKNVMLITEFTNDLWRNIKSNLISKLNKFKNNYKKYYSKSSIGEIYITWISKTCLSNPNNFELYDCKKLFGCKSKSCSLYDIKDNTIDSLLNTNKLNIKSLYTIILNNLSNNYKFDFKNSSYNRYFKNAYNIITDEGYLVGALLYDCVIEGGYCKVLLNSKIPSNLGYENDIVRKTIEQFANCKKLSLLKCKQNPTNPDCISCKYKFIDKFDTNYFIAYTLVNKLYEPIAGKQYTLDQRLQDVYRNMAGILELGKFIFNKLEDDINLYTSDVSLNIFYRYLSSEELSEILSYIGTQKCSNITNKKSWSIGVALSFIKNKIENLYKSNAGADEIYDLNKIKSILEGLNKDYKKKDNLEKLIDSLQAYRIFKERGYCQ